MSKRGRLSKAEQKFIRDNCEEMSDERIAAKLGKNVDSITRYRKIEIAIGNDLEKKVIDDNRLAKVLKTKPYWRNLQEQFSERELELVIYHWIEIIQQVNEDYTATEEIQILELIKIVILMHRALKEKNLYIKQKEKLDIELDNEYKKPLSERDKDWIMDIERQISLITNSQQVMSKEYTDLQDKQQKIQKELKFTRDQRIKVLNDSKSTWNSLLLSLQEEENREREGKEMAIMRGALSLETKRLSDHHQYMDKVLDRPLLTPDIVLEEEE